MAAEISGEGDRPDAGEGREAGAAGGGGQEASFGGWLTLAELRSLEAQREVIEVRRAEWYGELLAGFDYPEGVYVPSEAQRRAMEERRDGRPGGAV
jgi:hypothetical protein